MNFGVAGFLDKFKSKSSDCQVECLCILHLPFYIRRPGFLSGVFVRSGARFWYRVRWE